MNPRKLGLAGLVLLLAVLIAFAALWQHYQQFRTSPLAVPETGLILDFQAGSSLRGLARELVEQGVLPHPYWLRLLGRDTGLAARLQAGEYRIDPGTTPEALLRQLAAGRVLQHELTLVEGHTFRLMMERIRSHPVLVQTLAELPDEEIMRRIGHEGEHPEGRFLPDTYYFPRGTTDVEFLRRAYAAMERILEEAWAKRAEGLPLQTPYEALILASIVERETGLPGERGTIAGVFTRRLQKGMRLQTDPTVVYGIGTEYEGRIRYIHLRTDTPYNTYTRHGLPPTPIAMPGVEAIQAALHPEPGDALYFVSRNDGSHHFSATLAEHNRAVDKYQRNR
jgi:UPF0755 protein